MPGYYYSPYANAHIIYTSHGSNINAGRPMTRLTSDFLDGPPTGRPREYYIEAPYPPPALRPMEPRWAGGPQRLNFGRNGLRWGPRI